MTSESGSKAERLGIGRLQRHVFLCADQTLPLCCAKEVGLESWKELKRLTAELEAGGRARVFRTKANCLRICCDGPIAVVYPEGAWYRNCGPENIARIVEEHLVAGRVVTDLLVKLAPLGPGGRRDGAEESNP